MRFNDQGWLDVAVVAPGPIWKQSGIRPRTTGAVMHSSEGDAAGARAVLQGPREVSWPLTNFRDGLIEQGYPIQQYCWHARGGNSWTWGMEQVRRPSQVVTPLQVNNMVDVLAAYEDYIIRRRLPGWEHWLEHRRTAPFKNLFEHDEITATLCPSDSIPWRPIVVRLRATIPPPTPVPPPEEETMSSAEFDKVMLAIQGTNRYLALVGGLAQENANAAKFHTQQIDAIAAALVVVNTDLQTHLKLPVPPSVAELGSELDKLREAIAENAARMDAAAAALVAGREDLDTG